MNDGIQIIRYIVFMIICAAPIYWFLGWEGVYIQAIVWWIITGVPKWTEGRKAKQRPVISQAQIDAMKEKEMADQILKESKKIETEKMNEEVQKKTGFKVRE